MSDSRFIQVEQIHQLYDTYEDLYHEDATEGDIISHDYRANTPISAIRSYWQDVVSSAVGADLVNIRVMYMRPQNYRNFIPTRRGDGRPVTVEDLVTLCLPSYLNDDGFTLLLVFKYVRDGFTRLLL